MSQDWIFGIHAIEGAIERQPETLLKLWVARERQDQRLADVVADAQSMGLAIEWVAKKTLDEKSKGAVHQGVMAEIKAAKALNENKLAELLERAQQPLLLVLDGVTDPHNLGACLRTADAAGATAVIVPKNNSASLNATVRKVACGAAETVPLVEVTNLARTLRSLKEQGVWIVGTAGETDKTLYGTRLTGPMALVMGAEGKGLRRLTREHCDELVAIPMAGLVSSLNVSVATGVCLFEIVRQRQNV
ncbi:MAG: 23S rRNA (guanosine(2251)-2'-O)-methyltransferase RlmB [Pseudomonadota bacterium]|uniref:23S rRNA (guanosine-2'-O-)-methyltransferase RlmB n=1 Tax=Gallaecimonas pentaromativorans TaxID=584787 RepID=A0A3N1NU92_9GAMM|nr:23S rRNA (guanosine(2251)-2'-O)-methyltransferase RlmB [Gallaecimonas pentaromativorans]MED5523978.1 23S rRNA (guanosine(2251)-2'-O)-methyltransferase RlmB [Pseudomonadota bacterium]ROQ22402.1 23S rRNA Gm-2251 2'-O-methyltransferase [Gallaecimonas pentaromativorans]